MSQVSAQPLDPILTGKLQSSNNDIVMGALEQLRVAGTASYIPILTQMLLEHPDPDVRENIHRLLSELKDKAVVPVIVDLLKNDSFAAIHHLLLSACWSNGLDYSPYLPLLVEFVISGDAQTAFEALTVIENLETLPEAAICEQEIIKINRALQNATAEKTYLLQALRGVLA